MDDELVLRPATPEDAGALAQLNVAAWRWAYRGRGLPTYLALDPVAWTSIWGRAPDLAPARTVAAEQAGGLVGFVIFGAAQDADAAPSVGQVFAIYISESVLGRRREGARRQRAAGARRRGQNGGDPVGVGHEHLGADLLRSRRSGARTAQPGRRIWAAPPCDWSGTATPCPDRRVQGDAAGTKDRRRWPRRGRARAEPARKAGSQEEPAFRLLEVMPRSRCSGPERVSSRSRARTRAGAGAAGSGRSRSVRL